MPTFQVRNRITRIVLGTVTVEDPEDVLIALAQEAGCDIEDIARSLGKTVEAAKAALDIIQVDEGEREFAPPGQRRGKASSSRQGKLPLPPRRLFG